MADIIVVHGTPGAGKSTHSKRLANYTVTDRPVHHLSIGDRLRGIRNGLVESKYSDIVNSPDARSMLDHEVVNNIAFEFIEQQPEDSVILLDGYPRFPDAVDGFLKKVRNDEHTLLGCISMEVSLETSVNRITGRGTRSGERLKGDLPEFSEKRFVDHLRYTLHAVEAIEKESTVVHVNAEHETSEVWEAYNEAFNMLTSKENKE